MTRFFLTADGQLVAYTPPVEVVRELTPEEASEWFEENTTESQLTVPPTVIRPAVKWVETEPVLNQEEDQ